MNFSGLRKFENDSPKQDPYEVLVKNDVSISELHKESRKLMALINNQLLTNDDPLLRNIFELQKNISKRLSIMESERYMKL